MKIEIENILKLARIEIDEKEKKEIEKDFFSILKFVEKIEKVKTEGVKPMSYPIEVYNVMREDKKTNDKNQIVNSKKLISAAPETKDGFVKVKSILE
jgi:aspartyl-tRNA(Asn)/glutamyl-tRNA(Gln) amidotransferase subunit C